MEWLKINNCSLNFFKFKQVYKPVGGWYSSGEYVNQKVDRFNFSDETKNNFKKAKDILVELKKGVSLSNK